MRFIIHAIDRMLRKRLGMFEFCDDPDCIFRVSIGIASYPLRVPRGEIPAGAKVLELHFWNEHMPRMPDGGPLIGPAVRLRRMIVSSTRRLAESMKNDPRLAGVKAVGGVTPLFTPGDKSAAEGVFLRLGFALTPHKNPSGRFFEFWEEVYAWLLMWAFTYGTRKRRGFRGLRRTDFWMSAEDFLLLYGGPSKRTAGNGPHRDQAAL